jgi:hypothetical protein
MLYTIHLIRRLIFEIRSRLGNIFIDLSLGFAHAMCTVFFVLTGRSAQQDVFAVHVGVVNAPDVVTVLPAPHLNAVKAVGRVGYNFSMLVVLITEIDVGIVGAKRAFGTAPYLGVYFPFVFVLHNVSVSCAKRLNLNTFYLIFILVRHCDKGILIKGVIK